jgi:hypothetical protein
VRARPVGGGANLARTETQSRVFFQRPITQVSPVAHVASSSDKAA